MSWSKFFSMGGKDALNIWGSYAVALIVMGGEAILLRRRKKGLESRRERDRILSSEGDK